MSDEWKPPERAPRLIHRRCGGWLAVSCACEPLKIGVVADSEDAALRLFATTMARWRELAPPEKPTVPAQEPIAAVIDSCGCPYCDLGFKLIPRGRKVHRGPRGRIVECTKPLPPSG